MIAQDGMNQSTTGSKLTLGQSRELVKQSGQVSEMLNLMKPVRRGVGDQKRGTGAFTVDDELNISQ